ncbi:hypothetical protein [Neorhodopirellula pilleata]|uniref:Uncharacterized protein n=1 Tax=Neorhodopirellula pilleata TaxID=2714738 RepID=A0A5C6A6M6_9BACT|nr:hypothetical protein [Neorhodopirellula pilleata]TWT95035.1 hypothetical protein Pla100_36140 [Neorhodopirellula pilleata]
MISRRDFAIQSAAALSLSLAGLDRFAIAEEPGLSQKRLIDLGLNALARAPERNYFADGHRGASMISAHLMCVDNGLDDPTANRIIELFDLNWASGTLCEPFAAADPVEDAAEQIGRAFADGSGVLRQVGHDAIFAMHAIKGFRMLPESATPERVEGVCNLIKAFQPWRDVAPDDDIDPPPFDSTQEISRYILKEASDAMDRFVDYGQGFTGHLLTFGQSLVELAAMGDVEWAESGRVAFRKYLTVVRQGPQSGDRKIKPHAPSPLRPDDLAYWQKRGDKTLGLGHVFKYPYAYYDLIDRADDPQLTADLNAKAWRLF